MKKHFPHFLLAFCLLCAQVLAAAHAVEHTLEEGKGLPAHVCEFCLAAHDLGTGIAGKPAVPVTASPAYIPHHYSCSDRGALPAPQARQQSPPFA